MNLNLKTTYKQSNLTTSKVFYEIEFQLWNDLDNLFIVHNPQYFKN